MSEADTAFHQFTRTVSRRTRLRCADCGADIPVERIVDADGERLFGCMRDAR